MRRLAGLFAFLANALVAALIGAIAIPGPQRVIAPDAVGLTEVAPRIWTDDPGRAEALIDLTETAASRVGRFFDGPPPTPTLVLCATESCAADFGIGGNGLSLGPLAVLASPGGLTVGTLTHEMTHARLHRHLGLGNLIRQPFPTWFDEGLATFVADHPRWSGLITEADRARVRQVRRFWQLDDAFRALGVGRTYRAAAAEVAAIEDRAGRKGLLDLIQRAEDGEDFGAALARITGQ